MSDDNINMVMGISADTRQMRNSLKKIEKTLGVLGKEGASSFKKIEKAANKTQKSVSNMDKLFRNLSKVMVGLYALDKVKQYVSKVADVMDQWTQVTNRLKAVGVSTDQVASRQKELADLARETRSEFTATAELYSRLYRPMEQLGYAQSDVLTITKGINSAFAIGGSSLVEQIAATRQIVQGLGAGRLAGDELRSVLENAPEIALAIADGFGVAVGELKELGAEGALTTERLLPILIDKTSEWTRKLKDADKTIGQGFQNMTTGSNKLITSIGKLIDLDVAGWFDNGGQWASDTAEKVDGFKKSIDSLADTDIGFFEQFTSLDKYVAKQRQDRDRVRQSTAELQRRALIDRRESLDRAAKDPLFDKNHLKIMELREQAVGYEYATKHLNEYNNSLSQSPKLIDDMLASAGGVGSAMDKALADAATAGKDMLYGTQSESDFVQTNYGKAPTKKGSGGVSRSSRGRSRTTKDEFAETLASLRSEYDQVGLNETQLAKYNAIKQAGVDINSEQGRTLTTLIDNMEAKKAKLAETTEAQERYNQSIQQTGEFLGNSLINTMTSIADGTDKASDAFRKLAIQIAAAVAQSALLGTGSMGSLFAGSSGKGVVGNIIGSILRRANGGNANPNQAYMVGEQGRELFVPNTAGNIVSNKDLSSGGGGGNVTINQSFDFSNSDMSTVSSLRAETARIKQESVAAAVRAVKIERGRDPRMLGTA